MNFLSRLFGRRDTATPVTARRADAITQELEAVPGGNASGSPPQNARTDRDSVRFDATGVTRTLRDGRVECVTWDELQEVFILTTDDGPFVEDVFWVLSGNGRGCAIGSGTDGMESLLSRLQQLPGFDNSAVVQAMGSTSKAKFLCWRRTESTGAGA